MPFPRLLALLSLDLCPLSPCPPVATQRPALQRPPACPFAPEAKEGVPETSRARGPGVRAELCHLEVAVRGHRRPRSASWCRGCRLRLRLRGVQCGVTKNPLHSMVSPPTVSALPLASVLSVRGCCDPWPAVSQNLWHETTHPNTGVPGPSGQRALRWEDTFRKLPTCEGLCSGRPRAGSEGTEALPPGLPDDPEGRKGGAWNTVAQDYY